MLNVFSNAEEDPHKSAEKAKRALMRQYLKKPPPDTMQSVTKVYRIGNGPSSSHTMGPKRAAGTFSPHNSHVKVFRKIWSSMASWFT